MLNELLTDEAEKAINTEKAGIWMDSLVAKIIGRPPTPFKTAKPYSTDIKCAWAVVEWCMDYTGDLFIEYWQDGEWYISDTNLLSRNDIPTIGARSNRVDVSEDTFPSFPLAICRYALKCGICLRLITPNTLTDDPVTKGGEYA